MSFLSGTVSTGGREHFFIHDACKSPGRRELNNLEFLQILDLATKNYVSFALFLLNLRLLLDLLILNISENGS